MVSQALAPSPTSSPDQLAREHLPLVHHAVASVAGQVPRTIPHADLVSAALHGLAGAARSYTAGEDLPFDSYALGRMRRALLEEVRAPQATKAGLGIDAATRERLTADVGRATVASHASIVSLPEASEGQRRAHLGSAIEALPGRLRRVVVGSFHEGRPPAELAEEMGVTERMVERLRAEALRRLHAATPPAAPLRDNPPGRGSRGPLSQTGG